MLRVKLCMSPSRSAVRCCRRKHLTRPDQTRPSTPAPGSARRRRCESSAGVCNGRSSC
ncbi:hypothetical protein BKA80DRAFT_279344 [Phyllosticta citrichinensis]